MKKIIPLLAFGVMLSAHKCNEGTAASASIAGTKWALASVNGKAIEVPEGAQTPWLQLSGEGNDQVQGFGGCNQLMGSFTQDGDKIGFPGLGSTKMYCEQTSALEKSFLEALRSTDSYTMEGDRLLLMAGGREVAALVAQP